MSGTDREITAIDRYRQPAYPAEPAPIAISLIGPKKLEIETAPGPGEAAAQSVPRRSGGGSSSESYWLFGPGGRADVSGGPRPGFIRSRPEQD